MPPSFRELRSLLASLKPRREGWIGLVASPSSYALVSVAGLTFVIKALTARDLGGADGWLHVAIWAGAPDVAVYGGLAALFSVGEGRFRWLRWVTWTTTLVLLALALINAGYLYVTGEQLTWEAVELGTARFGDLWDIVRDHLASFGWGATLAIALLSVAPPALLTLWRHRRGGFDARREGEQRAVAAGILAAAAFVLAAVLPDPVSPAARRLGANATFQTYWSWVTSAETEAGRFTGYEPRRIVSEAEIARFSRGRRPNVVIVVLESTRWDRTSLAGASSPAETPHLLALAERGLTATHARAVVPHTTKSLWTILCGRFPLMQAAIIEPTGWFPSQCLPAILRDAGYITGFVQSARGGFEYRFRLVQELGYQQFAAWEDLRGEPLGYLASDDESLIAPAKRFIKMSSESGAPFLLTVLTSATHHPYRLPGATLARARAQGRPKETPEERYARLVETADLVLGEIVRELEARKLLESTYLVVVGDHGEGFGRKGVRQHDNNFWEEGLRVPFVIVGPDVPRRRIDGNVSLFDVTPTLLGRLGIQVMPEAAPTLQGFDLLAGPVPDVPRIFSCWYSQRCRGFVWRHRKVVHVPESGLTFALDLARDPGETKPFRLDPELRRQLLRVHAVVESYQAKRSALPHAVIR